MNAAAEERNPRVRKGELWQVVSDLPITVMTAWAAPYTGGHKALLKAGERFTINNDPPEGATAVYADPVDYKRLHRELVPRRDRFRFWLYRGYYLAVYLNGLATHCKRIDTPED